MTADTRIPAQDIFAEAIRALVLEHDNLLVLDADRAGRSGAHAAAESKSESFLMLGAAEAALMGVAAGLALTGWTACVPGFNGADIRRILEPLHTIIGPQNLNVKLVGFWSGIPVHGEYFETQDLALLRPVPNLAVIVPADAVEARQALATALQHPGPAYIRLADLPEAPLCSEDYVFAIGRAVKMRDGADVAMICTGRQTLRALHAAAILETVSIRAGVLHVPTVQPLDTEAVLAVAEGVRLVVTAEEHGTRGGLGEAVAEALSGGSAPPMRRFGFRRGSGEILAREDFLEEQGLTAARMAESIHTLLHEKQVSDT
jgi:transketolase